MHRMSGIRATALTAIALCLTSCTDAAAPGNDTITAANLSADLHILAADSMRGRLVGTPEEAKAGDWIRARFEQLGLEPAGSGGFDQRFDLVWFSLGAGNHLTISGAGFNGRPRQPGDGYYPLNVSASTTATGPLAFAGFGIVEPRLEYNDYRTGDAAGKIVLVLEREPGVDDPASPFDGVVTAESSATWRKALAAQENGAAGILFVRDIHNRPDSEDYQAALRATWPEEPRRIERFSLAVWMDRLRIPAAQVSAALAERLVAGSGHSLQELAASSETTAGLGVIDLPGPTVVLTAQIERHTTPGRNILAKVEGTDPALRDEVVIISAHYDHNGADGDEIFNGADDDGSGIVGLMAIAGAYAAAANDGHRPERSVIFAAWDAEERGLLGAWYYTESPSYPLDQTVAVLNMDMIGRNEEVPADGGGRFRGLEVQSAESNANAINILGRNYTADLANAVVAANEDYGLELKFRYDNNESNLLRRSDHWPFLQRGVPAVWFHTGLHPDYHTARDDADLIEYPKMERIAKLVHRTSWDLANAAVRPAMSPPAAVGVGRAAPQRQARRLATSAGLRIPGQTF
jgi:Peptidase family M28